MVPNLFTLKNLCFSYSPDVSLFKNFSLEIQEGDFVVLLGSNGCGKSTLLKLLSGHLTPQSGTISCQKKPISRLSMAARNKTLCYLSQDSRQFLFHELTVDENARLICLREGCRTGALKAEHMARFYAQLKNINASLIDRKHIAISDLSGGQRQSLCLALALFHPVTALLLDEHTSALDPRTGKRMMSLTNQCIVDHKVTSIMTTHNLDDALRYGNRLIMLHQGDIVLDVRGSAKESLTEKQVLGLYKHL